MIETCDGPALRVRQPALRILRPMRAKAGLLSGFKVDLDEVERDEDGRAEFSLGKNARRKCVGVNVLAVVIDGEHVAKSGLQQARLGAGKKLTAAAGLDVDRKGAAKLDCLAE